jgi:hypothetical protein
MKTHHGLRIAEQGATASNFLAVAALRQRSYHVTSAVNDRHLDHGRDRHHRA